MSIATFSHRIHWRFLSAVNDALFCLFWPAIARLPVHLGMKLASAIGLLCYWLDLDWRTVALRDHYVKQRTRLALTEICGSLEAPAIEHRVRGRFINAAREELEGHWFHLDRARECRCDFEGIDAIKQHMAQGGGIVLLTLHFDATLMGVVQMGLAGIRLNLMTSNVVEDQRVPLSVQRYFRQKYAGIEAHLNGGRSLHVESHLKAFYTGLRRGEAAVILGEAPTARLEEALDVHFLGRRRAIAPGAVRLAERMNCPMAAFVCLRFSAGHYRVVFSPVLLPSPAKGHSENTNCLFSFLDAHIRNSPERWWAADQLPNFINLDGSSC